VFLQRLPSNGEAAADSAFIGTTPLRDVRVARADHRVAVHKPGYAAIERIASSAYPRSERGVRGRHVELRLALLPADSVPPGMVPIPGGPYEIVSPDVSPKLRAELRPYWLDAYEVTNEQYAGFVRSGGYATAALRQSRFADRTGLPGPRGWLSQEAPRGEERHPVTGVTWYEAAAYCAAAGKRLPTLYEWEKAARNGVASHFGVIMPWGYTTAASHAGRRANFSGVGTMPVDSLPFGISPYGAYAMAGNVKEWLANPVGDGFAVAGGSWQDPAYLFSELGALPGATATPALGFRCARTAAASPDEVGVAGDQGADPLRLEVPTPVYRPLAARTVTMLLSHYRYDRQPANPRGVTVVETADWTRERLWVDGVGGAGRDSVLIYLYLPKRAAPPYQVLAYVPSSAAFFFRPVWQDAEDVVGPHIKGGRAVLSVALKGMVERPQPPEFTMPPSGSVRFRDLMVLHATELRLALDYLATRADIDVGRLAYVGFSFGAGSRLPLAAVDERYRSMVLIGAGIDERVQPTLPEVANFNFAPSIRVPKLVVNGRHDEEHPWITRGLPLWTLLREPKELVLIDGMGHLPAVEQRVPPINAFLDRTLGPVALREP
jgi:formylglycine-generating enzyme required for sulfatase activity